MSSCPNEQESEKVTDFLLCLLTLLLFQPILIFWELVFGDGDGIAHVSDMSPHIISGKEEADPGRH